MLSARAKVKGQRQRRIGPDAGACRVESELADGDTHAVDTQVTEAENARAVGDNGNLHMLGPVVDYRVKMTLVGEREVQALRLSVDFGPSLAGFADRRRVDQGRDLLFADVSVSSMTQAEKPVKGKFADLDVTGEQAVEEMDVGGFEPGEVLEFLEVGGFEVEDLETCMESDSYALFSACYIAYIS